MDSIETKINQMKVAFQEFYTSTGVQNLIKGIIDFITRLINRFNDFTKAWDKFPVLALGVITSIITSIKSGSSIILDVLIGKTNQLKATIISAMQEAGTVGGQAVQKGLSKGLNGKSITGGALSLAGSMVSMAGLGVKDDTTAGALGIGGSLLQGAGTFLQVSTMLPGPWGKVAAAVAAIASALPGISSSIGLIFEGTESTAEKLERLNKELETESNESILAKSELDELVQYRKKLEDARASMYDSIEAKQEYLDLSNEIASKYGELVAGYDAEGNAVISLGDAYQYLLRSKSAMYREERVDEFKKEMAFFSDADVATRKYLSNPYPDNGKRRYYNYHTSEERDFIIKSWKGDLFDDISAAIIEGGKDGNLQSIVEKTIANNISTARYQGSALLYNAQALGVKDALTSTNVTESIVKAINSARPQGVEITYASGYNSIMTSEDEGSFEDIRNYYIKDKAGHDYTVDLDDMKYFNDFNNLMSKIMSEIGRKIITGETEQRDGKIYAKTSLTPDELSILSKRAFSSDDFITQGSVIEFEVDPASNFLNLDKYFSGINDYLERQKAQTEKNLAFDMAEIDIDSYGADLDDFQKNIFKEYYAKQFEALKGQMGPNAEIGKVAEEFVKNSVSYSAEIKTLLSSENAQIKNLSQQYSEVGKGSYNDLNSLIAKLSSSENEIDNLVASLYESLKLSYEDIILQIEGLITFIPEYGEQINALASTVGLNFLPDFYKDLSYYSNMINNASDSTAAETEFGDYLSLIEQFASDDNAQRIIEMADKTTLQGLLELRENLKEAGYNAEEDLVNINNLINNHIVNFETEWALYQQSVSSAMEEMEKAVNNAVGGMSLEEAQKMAQKLGKNLSDFDVFDGKFFYNSVEEITKVYSGVTDEYRDELISKTNTDLQGIAELGENFDIKTTSREEALDRVIAEESKERINAIYDYYDDSMVTLGEYQSQLVNNALLQAGELNQFFEQLKKDLNLDDPQFNQLKNAFLTQDSSKLQGESLSAYLMYVDGFTSALENASKDLVDSTLAFIREATLSGTGNETRRFDVTDLVEAGLFDLSTIGQNQQFITDDGRTYVELSLEQSKKAYQEQAKNLYNASIFSLEQYNDAMANFYEAQKKDVKKGVRDFAKAAKDGITEKELSDFATSLGKAREYIIDGSGKIDWEVVEEIEGVDNAQQSVQTALNESLADLITKVYESGGEWSEEQLAELAEIQSAYQTANITMPDLPTDINECTSSAEGYFTYLQSLAIDTTKAFEIATEKMNAPAAAKEAIVENAGKGIKISDLESIAETSFERNIDGNGISLKYGNTDLANYGNIIGNELIVSSYDNLIALLELFEISDEQRAQAIANWHNARASEIGGSTALNNQIKETYNNLFKSNLKGQSVYVGDVVTQSGNDNLLKILKDFGTYDTDTGFITFNSEVNEAVLIKALEAFFLRIGKTKTEIDNLILAAQQEALDSTIEAVNIQAEQAEQKTFETLAGFWKSGGTLALTEKQRSSVKTALDALPNSALKAAIEINDDGIIIQKMSEKVALGLIEFLHSIFPEVEDEVINSMIDDIVTEMNSDLETERSQFKNFTSNDTGGTVNISSIATILGLEDKTTATIQDFIGWYEKATYDDLVYIATELGTSTEQIIQDYIATQPQPKGGYEVKTIKQALDDISSAEIGEQLDLLAVSKILGLENLASSFADEAGRTALMNQIIGSTRYKNNYADAIDELVYTSAAVNTVLEGQAQNLNEASDELSKLLEAKVGDKVNLTYLADAYGSLFTKAGLTLDSETGAFTITKGFNPIDLLRAIMVDGANGISESMAEVADMIQQIFDSWANIIVKGISGGLTNTEAAELTTRLGLQETDFYRSSEGLKLTEDASKRIYQTMKETDEVSSRIVLDALVESAKEADERMNDILFVEQRIKDVENEIENTGNDPKRLNALNSELDVATEIKNELLEAGNAFNFMNRDVRTDLTNPLSAWEGLAQAMQVIEGEDFKNGRMSYQDFSNIADILQRGNAELKNAAGETIDIANMLAKGQESLDTADGNVFVSLSKMGAEYQISAEDYKEGIAAGVREVAKAEIERLSGLKELLEGMQLNEEAMAAAQKAQEEGVGGLLNSATDEIGDLSTQGIAIQTAFKNFAEYAGFSTDEINNFFNFDGLNEQQIESRLKTIVDIILTAQTDIESATGKLKQAQQDAMEAISGEEKLSIPFTSPIAIIGGASSFQKEPLVKADDVNYILPSMTAEVGTLAVTPNKIEIALKEGQEQFIAEKIAMISAPAGALTISSTDFTYVNSEELAKIPSVTGKASLLTLIGYTNCLYDSTAQAVVFDNIVDATGKFGKLILTKSSEGYQTVWENSDLVVELNGSHVAVANMAMLKLLANDQTTYKDNINVVSLDEEKDANANLSDLNLYQTENSDVKIVGATAIDLGADLVGNGTLASANISFVTGTKINAIAENGALNIDGSQFDFVMTNGSEPVTISIPVEADTSTLSGLKDRITQELLGQGFTFEEASATASSVVYQASLNVLVGQEGVTTVQSAIDQLIEDNNGKQIDVRINIGTDKQIAPRVSDENSGIDIEGLRTLTDYASLGIELHSEDKLNIANMAKQSAGWMFQTYGEGALEASRLIKQLNNNINASATGSPLAELTNDIDTNRLNQIVSAIIALTGNSTILSTLTFDQFERFLASLSAVFGSEGTAVAGVNTIKSTLEQLQKEDYKINLVYSIGAEKTEEGKYSVDVQDGGTVDTLMNLSTALINLNTQASTLAQTSNAITDNGPEQVSALKNAMDSIQSKAKEVNATANAINRLRSRVIEAKVNISVNFDGIETTTPNASASVDLTSDAKGNFAYAKGTLMGELGPELVVSNGRYYTVGNNGAEFVNLPSDAIVFNHLQTRELLGKGTTSTGTPKVSEKKSVSMATGNARASISDAIAKIDEQIRMWQSLVSLNASDLASKAGGGGGGGGGSSEEMTAFTHDLERWYNLLRQIEKLEQRINYLQAERENIVSGYTYVDNLERELRTLRKQQQAYTKLAELQKSYYDRRREDLLSTDYSKIFTYDEDGLMQYVDGKGYGLDILATLNATDEHGVAKMNAKQQVQYLKNNGFDISQFMTKADGTKIKSNDYTGILEEFWSGIDNWMSELDGLYDEYNDHLTSIEDNQSAQNDIIQEYIDNQMSVEEKLVQAIEEREQAEIDKLQENINALSDSASQYISGLNDALQKEQDMYNQNEEDAETARLQRQLAILQRSGGSASEIKSLQDQLDSRLQDSYFSEQERQIQAVQDASEAQLEKLQQQLDVMTESLEYQKENGLLWQEVSDMMMSWTPEAMLAFIERYTSSYKTDSTLSKEEASKETLKELEIWDAKRKANERNSAWEAYLEGAQGRYDEMTIYKGELAANEAYLETLKAQGTKEEAAKAADEVFNNLVNEEARRAAEAEQNAANASTDTSDKTADKKKAKAKKWQFSWGETKKSGYSTKKDAEEAIQELAQSEMKLLTSAYQRTGMSKETAQAYALRSIGAKASFARQTLKQYERGGLVDFTGPAWVDGSKSKPEAFLSAEDTALLKSKIFSNSNYSLKSVIEALEMLGREFTSIDNSSIQRNMNFENVNVQIQSGVISSDYDARRAGELVLEEMTKIARRTSNIGVARR